MTTTYHVAVRWPDGHTCFTEVGRPFDRGTAHAAACCVRRDLKAAAAVVRIEWNDAGGAMACVEEHE